MIRVRSLGMGALLGLALFGSLTAGAQQVYRIVGPDGKVTFSDRPPADAKATPAATVALPGAGSSTASLPFEVRNAASRFPVTLYTAPDCGACGGARNYLTSRGIPFSERTVTSEDDLEALKRLAGAARVPFLTIGGQQLKGFAEPEWAQYLDAAGYPRTSQLPAGFRNPPPAPLVSAQAAPRQQAQQPAQQAQQQPQQPAEAPAEAPANPTGIRF